MPSHVWGYPIGSGSLAAGFFALPQDFGASLSYSHRLAKNWAAVANGRYSYSAGWYAGAAIEGRW